MKLSQLFTKTSRETPSDEQSVSAQLLERAGYIHKEAAGVYSLLPLGLRVANNIAHIIRQEMNAIGGQEILMSGLVPKANLEKSGRWATFDALFKLKGADEKEYALGATHEEIIAPLMRNFVHSYKDLPFAAYQIQNKFRNEIRAKSGVLRTREFIMKDLYSFHKDEQDLSEYYEKAKDAYWKIFERCGIKDKTYLTLASGGSFAKYSHEFQTETEAGEDEIYVCKNCRIAVNREIMEGEHSAQGGPASGWECPECHGKDHDVKKTIEVGNIFKLGTKYSDPFELSYADENGENKPVVMGCYGIGLQRLMGAIVEVHHDDKGIRWPANIAPFLAHLIDLNGQGESIYNDLFGKAEQKVDVIWDDRDISAGEKFADADLLGIPYRLVISEKTGEKIEIKKRAEDGTELASTEEIIGKIVSGSR
jgi:prolyl-tRNA synthetase